MRARIRQLPGHHQGNVLALLPQEGAHLLGEERSRGTVPLMDPRPRLTRRDGLIVVLTALAGPAGAISAALLLARVAEATTGGMASLVGAVIGMIFGGPVLAWAVFALCLGTLGRTEQRRRGAALFAMGVSCLIVLGLLIVVPQVLPGSESIEDALPLMALAMTALLAQGSAVALVVSRTPSPAHSTDTRA